MGQYGLSDTELEIMELFWSQNQPLLFGDIMDFFISQGKNWKKQTLHTHLSRLIEKNALTCTKKGQKNIYALSCSKADYISTWTNSLLDSTFNGSINDFMVALVGARDSLSQKELDELRKFLNE